MFSEFYVEIQKVHPSQLFINRTKRLRVKEWIKPETHNYQPIPVKKYGEKLFLTDGHTRAVCIREAGCTHMKVVWDQDDLDDSEYLICIEWCQREGILSIDDLKIGLYRMKIIKGYGFRDVRRHWYRRVMEMVDKKLRVASFQFSISRKIDENLNTILKSH